MRENGPIVGLPEIKLRAEHQDLAGTVELENASSNWPAIISTLLFCASALAWPLGSWVATSVGSHWERTLWVVLLMPMISGASGASIRVVVDWAAGRTNAFELSTYSKDIVVRYVAFGMIAGGLAGVLFVLAQLFAIGIVDSLRLTGQLSKLVPFLVILGFAAGLTAEVVLSKLRNSSPVLELPGITPNSTEKAPRL